MANNKKKKNRKKAAAKRASTLEETAATNRKAADTKRAELMLSVAHKWKGQGNDAFKTENYHEAISCYRKALDAIKDSPGNGADREFEYLRVDLHNNISMTFLKLEEYEQSEAECTFVLDHLSKLNPKVWYRRALARYNLAKGDRRLLEEGLSDLNESIRLLHQESEQNTNQHRVTKQSVQNARNQFRQALEQIKPSASEPENVLPPVLLVEPMKNPPSKELQKETVLKLLVARKESLLQHPNLDEALFVIDWDWWLDWTDFVSFFDADSILHLPNGSVVPGEEEKDDGISDPPGPIDNSSLVLIRPERIESKRVESTREYFVKTWYRNYFCAPITPETNAAPFVPLKPHLVRGYHYELIPREVYNALRSWFGETSPSICRRASRSGEIEIYPMFSENGKLAQGMSICAACQVTRATMRCKRCMVVYYCQQSCQQSHWPYHKVECKRMENLDMLDRLPGPLPRGRVGLGNLGNTCFMNAALQCLSHATPLTRHFLSNSYCKDLNEDNPLGTGGKLAQAYAGVLKELWMRNGVSSTNPTGLKRAIAKFAPRFAGSLQHDSQEFLAYLLDGLHEDMNRVRSKPYVEFPDVGEDQDMAVAGARAWDCTSRRDDSLVMDTFYGQFKSTCVCPQCDRVSVSFDTFNHVSLELPRPMERVEHAQILVMPTVSTEEQDIPQKPRLPLRCAVPVKRSDNIATLRTTLAHDLEEADPNRLVVCEVRNGQISDCLHTQTSVTEILASPSLFIACRADPFDGPFLHFFCTNAVINPEKESECTPFSFPFLASFSEDTTCSQVWENIWSRVRYYAKNGLEDLEIHLYKRNRPHLLFPLDEAMFTSAIPRDSDERLLDFLGQEDASDFIHLWLEWQVVPTRQWVENCERFDEHMSWIEYSKTHNDAHASPATTLQECLEAFTRPERLDKDNMWYCSRCKAHVQAKKTMELWRLPNVWIIHLKRFEFRRRRKLEGLVKFPLVLEVMDSSSEAIQVFDLFAVTNHLGRSMGFGHYTAFARGWTEEKMDLEWTLFDDSRTSVVPEEQVVSPAAYILFYRRRSFR